DLTDGNCLQTVRARTPLDERTATAVSPQASSPEAAAAVHEDEAEPQPVTHERAAEAERRE
ncbi:MAG: hypothetical protein R2712_30395, partial [Vicinamibacterales bacterium]